MSLTLEKQFKSLYIASKLILTLIAYTYRNKSINEQEFAILYDAHKSTNPEFPYWNYERFD